MQVSASTKGESLDSLSKQGAPSAGSASIAPDDKGFLWINRDSFHKAFVGDATPTEAAVMAAVQKPLSIASFTGKEDVPAWKTIRSWYLVSANDQMIPPPAQEFMAKRMGATVHSVPASHASMISRPHEVADIDRSSSGFSRKLTTQTNPGAVAQSNQLSSERTGALNEGLKGPK